MVRPAPESPDHGLARIGAALFRPVDIASLVAFRICFGLLMSYEAIQLLTPYADSWIERAFFFTYPGFSWVRPLPGIGPYLHCYALAALGLLVAAGAFYRVSLALFCAGFTYVFLIDETEYLNHFYLICLISFLMIFMPAHRSLSVDAWLRPRLRGDSTPAWPVFALRAQMGMVYFFGGLAKLEPDWLRGLPTGIWLPEKLTAPLLREIADERWLALFIAWGGLLLDLLIVPALLHRRTRPYAFAAGVAFHLTNSQLFHIGIFPWFAMAATLIFFEPDWPRRVFNWPRATSRKSVGQPTFAWTPSRRAVAIGLALYFGVHAVLPFRHLLYPGRAIWTEEGHRFAWRMMLRKKMSIAVFKLEDPRTGRSWIVNPADELTPRQTGRLASRPRWLHLYANHLADLAAESGEPRPRVQAMTLVSLNGRPPVPIVDPTVDLAAEPARIFSHAPWIVGLTDDRFVKDPVWQDIARDLVEKYGENAWKQ